MPCNEGVCVLAFEVRTSEEANQQREETARIGAKNKELEAENHRLRSMSDGLVNARELAIRANQQLLKERDIALAAEKSALRIIERQAREIADWRGWLKEVRDCVNGTMRDVRA
jgi:hypothetical protein